MKISDLEVITFEWTGRPATNFMNQRQPAGHPHQNALLTIRTDNGIEGHCLLGRPSGSVAHEAANIIERIKPQLLGKEALKRESLHALLTKLAAVTSVRAIGSVDIALWDIAGKAANQPIHTLLGTYRDKIPVYASSAKMDRVEQYVEEALRYKAMNWKAYKIHPPAPWQRDIEVVTAVRKAVGDDFILMLDSSRAYEYEEALKVGRAIDELDYHWFEEPLGEYDVYNYVKLKQKLKTPIMATERPVAGLDSYAPWIMAQATDFLRGDPAMKGGITPVVKAAHLAEAFRMKFEVHAGLNSLVNLANLHIEMAIRNTTFHEILLPVEAINHALVNEPRVDADGFIQPPEGPGLGALIDFDLIKHHQIQVLR
jgi:L-alanine-DL-glutamate epimerase-like enolase superfamily enzyme